MEQHPAEPRPQGATIEALGRSEAFLQFSEQLAAAAKVNRPVLLIGERGTGKELAAARLHLLSPRWSGPLVTLNCAALPPALQEAELFGHEAGAFTGAVARRQGRFELAHSGTLFLDEIGNMDMALQEKILRAVEYGVFERLGGVKSVEVDVRVIGATNADLPALVRKGRFKRDLLDRLSFEVLTLPPLRVRGEDILLLAERFAAGMAAELSRDEAPRFAPQAMEQLMTHSWPGNVRELKNVVERAVYRSDSDVVFELVVDPFASPHAPREQGPGPEASAAPEPLPPAVDFTRPLQQAVQDLEVAALRAALAKARHNQKRAAALLGLSYHQLRGLVRKHRDRLETQAGG